MLEKRRVKLGTGSCRKAKELLREAFPPEELFPFWMLRVTALRRCVDFFAYYDGKEFAGLSYAIEGDECSFVLYLAVNPRVRSRGYGSAILADIASTYPGKPIYLDVEPVEKGAPNYEQRVKRLRFYERNGFARTGYRVKGGEDVYDVLANNADFDPAALTETMSRLTFGRMAPDIKKVSG